MLKDIKLVAPEDIETESMRIIESEMDEQLIKSFTPEELKVVKRCIIQQPTLIINTIWCLDVML